MKNTPDARRNVSWLLMTFLALAASCGCCRCKTRPPAPPTPLTLFSVPPDTIVPTDSQEGVSPGTAADQFAVSADGAATYSYPIWTPKGRRNIEPLDQSETATCC